MINIELKNYSYWLERIKIKRAALVEIAQNNLILAQRFYDDITPQTWWEKFFTGEFDYLLEYSNLEDAKSWLAAAKKSYSGLETALKNENRVRIMVDEKTFHELSE